MKKYEEMGPIEEPKEPTVLETLENTSEYIERLCEVLCDIESHFNGNIAEGEEKTYLKPQGIISISQKHYRDIIGLTDIARRIKGYIK